MSPQTTQTMSCPFSSLAPALSLSLLCWETESLGGRGVEVGPTRGGLEAPGLRAPPLRAWWRGREDMEMELIPEIPELGEAIRAGSLHTEVGGATRAMSGIGETVGRRGVAVMLTHRSDLT